MLSWVALLLISFLSTISGKQLHDYMTMEEIESIFRVKHDEVHTIEYEVVPIVRRFARSIEPTQNASENSTHSEFEKHSIYLETFGENFELYLEENNNTLFGDQTPVIQPYMDSSGHIKYDKKDYDLIPQLKMSTYHDREKRAALTMYEDENGRINVNGIVDNLVIRAIPKRLHEEVLIEHPSLSKSSNAFNETDETHHHIVIKRNAKELSWFERQFIRLLDWIAEVRQDFCSCRLLASPSDYKEFTIYPKILLILDHATFLLHNQSVVECVKYMIAYWNIVDLRFRRMDKPEVRLNIAGIIIATKPNLTPYIEKQTASDDYIDIYRALLDMELYFNDENMTQVDYDIAVEFTPQPMGEPIPWWRSVYAWLTNADQSSFTTSITRQDSICYYPRQAMTVLMDQGDLTLTDAAAHEIGHVLGAKHDPNDLEEDDPDYKSHWKHGFIMSYERVNNNQMLWSDLSIRRMQQFLQMDHVTHCMLKKPNVGTPYRKILPGKILNRDEQCKIRFGSLSFSHRDPEFLDDCLNSFCYSPITKTYIPTYIPVSDGSYCGEQKICIEGKCVHDPTDPIVYQNLSIKVG